MEQFSVFSTPIVVYHLVGMEQLNHDLSTLLIAESEHTPSVETCNIGGWHSRPDLGQRPEPCFRMVMDWVLHYVRITFGEAAKAVGVVPSLQYRYAIHGWGAVMRHGDYAICHDHVEAHWSVVYYPDAGDADLARYASSGNISFLDPRRGSAAIPGADIFPGTFSIAPRDSAMVVFPGWLQHYVHPYRGHRPRVSLSFNIKIEPIVPGT